MRKKVLYFTDEQMKRLADCGAVAHMRSAVYFDYKRVTNFYMNNIVADVLDAVMPTKNSRHYGCGQCVLNLYRKAGEIFFTTLKKRQEEDENYCIEDTQARQQNAKPKVVKGKKPKADYKRY